MSLHPLCPFVYFVIFSIRVCSYILYVHLSVCTFCHYYHPCMSLHPLCPFVHLYILSFLPSWYVRTSIRSICTFCLIVRFVIFYIVVSPHVLRSIMSICPFCPLVHYVHLSKWTAPSYELGQIGHVDRMDKWTERTSKDIQEW